nr:ATP-binding protein [Massilia sp. TS11]
MLAISVATFVVYFAINRLFGDPLEDIARRQAAAQIFLLEQYIDQAPADEWLLRLNKVREVSNIAYELLPLASVRPQIAPAQRAAFERGEIVMDVGAKAFYRRVDLKGNAYVGADEEAIRASGLPIDVGLALRMEVVRFVVVALALLIPIALWSRAHWQDLQRLSAVADAVGEGELTARAALAPSASVYPLAQHINRMAERIAALLAAQQTLLHSVSHELRTPIARLQFALELVRDVPPGPDLTRRLAGMEADLAELDALVGELLSMNRLSAQPTLLREDIDLAAALRELVASLDHTAGAEHIVLDLAPDLGHLTADRRLLLRAVGNLLKNALKYAARSIHLQAGRTAQSVWIVVEDDGPGIPEAEWDKVFTPFYRLDRSRDRNTGGFGLGLAIARQAVDLHRGSLQVGRAALGGARFVISLPLDANA